MTLCCREQWQNGLFRHVACEGDALVLPPAPRGCVLPPPAVDSGEKGFARSRLIVDAVLPQDCGLRIYTSCADAPDWAAWEALRAAFVDAPWEDDPLPLLRRCLQSARAAARTARLSGAGRYLCDRFRTDGDRRVRAFCHGAAPAHGWRPYDRLPAVRFFRGG